MNQCVFDEHDLLFDGGKLRVYHFLGNGDQDPILLVHGAIENGRIFFSQNGKGLAPFLAGNGHNVFVIDLPGKGKSLPLASKNGRVLPNQTTLILKILPQVLEWINKLMPNRGIHLMGHSWGGVLILALLARFPQQFGVKSLTFFGSKRRISLINLKKILLVDLIWTGLGSLFCATLGYFPAKRLRIGDDDEPRDFFFQMNRWVYSRRWVDSVDQFDYAKALTAIDLPPILSLTGQADDLLGHPVDVQKLLEQSHAYHAQFRVIGKSTGFAHNYDHINLLTHPSARMEVFPLVLNFLQTHSPG